MIYAIRGKTRWATIAILVLVAAMTGYRVHSELQSRLSTLESVRKLSKVRHHAIRATVLETGNLDEQGTRYRAVLTDVSVMEDGQERPIPGNFRISASDSDQEQHFVQLSHLPVGSRIALRGRIRPVEPRYNFHAPNPESLALYQNMMGRIQADWESVRILARDGGNQWMLARWLERIRDGMAERIQTNPNPEHSGRLRAFLLNDYSRVSRTELESLRSTGLFHLYAISGTHFASFALILVALLRTFLSTRMAYAWTSGILLVYLAILGFPPAATRAWVMIAAVTASWALRRESDSISAWILAATAILAVDPFLITHRGFQLSFAGSFGIMTATTVLIQAAQESRTSGWRGDVLFGLKASLAASLGAACFVFPLQIYLFQNFHMLSLLSNLWGAFLTGWALAGAFAAVVLGFFSSWIGDSLLVFSGLCLTALGSTAGLLDKAPYLTFRPAQPPDWSVFLAYSILLSGTFLVQRSTPEFFQKAAARFLISGLLSVLIVSGAAWTFAGPSGYLRLTVLDVGQGDATLIEMPDGSNFLVDGGNSASVQGVPVLPAEVRALGYHRLPRILATHVDADHVAGLIPLVRQLPVPAVLEASPDSTASLIQNLRDAAKTWDPPIPVQIVGAGDILSRGPDWELRVLYPPHLDRVDYARSPETAGRNLDSIVLLLRYREFSTLLMGDAPDEVEHELLDQGRIQPVTVLRLGHHGSQSSSAPEFLDVTSPSLALVSCGLGNSYGHPATEVLDRLTQRGIPLARTDQHGAIQLETDGHSLSLRFGRQRPADGGEFPGISPRRQ